MFLIVSCGYEGKIPTFLGNVLEELFNMHHDMFEINVNGGHSVRKLGASHLDEIPIACTMVGKIKRVVSFTKLDLPESCTLLCV
mgnify:CR=1 FL=1